MHGASPSLPKAVGVPGKYQTDADRGCDYGKSVIVFRPAS